MIPQQKKRSEGDIWTKVTFEERMGSEGSLGGTVAVGGAIPGLLGGATTSIIGTEISGDRYARERTAEERRERDEVVTRPRRVKPLQKHPVDGRVISPANTEAGDSSLELSAVRLVDRAREGDVEAFRELVELYQKRAFAVAYGVLGNSNDAEDVVQDAFVKVFQKLHSFRGQSSFYTWLYRIVFNLSVDLSRRRYRTRELQFGDQAGVEIAIAARPISELNSSPNPEELLSRGELRGEMATAFAALSPEHRAVVTLREIEGLSYSEISDVTGVSKGTVMSRLFHARKKLQRALSLFRSGESAIEDGSDEVVRFQQKGI